MDEIRAVVTTMKEHEGDVMERRQHSVSRIALLIWGVMAALAVALVLFGLSAAREAVQRRRLSRFLPLELVSRLADDDDSLRNGRRQQAVIVFVDMRGSTAIAEQLDPHQLSTFLSAYRRRVMRLARAYGGVVDKFIGDGALIVFGLPEPQHDDAARAVDFACDLVEVIARWNEKGEHAVPVRIGVGIHSGEVFSGIIVRRRGTSSQSWGTRSMSPRAWSRPRRLSASRSSRRRRCGRPCNPRPPSGAR